ncbi:zinc-binding dehydrogenase [Streptomyces sp. NBC_00378]|uniref:zinc-binding dehydrogenase n=1 Tax=unclassified Streptomyces TaxID=2593676 RepID=UPI0022529AC7|nr:MULTISPECIES: zinc-binding dehydrogenase [unclassified Streptomyces]MCX5112563.1 zinc-binding dehydrogenase [Streptomyces sp. NBC_00378]
MWTTQGERSVWGQVPDEGDPREGLTASHLSTDTYPIGPGDTAVVHAAAGGVGLLLTQVVKAHGGRVIGQVSREGKAPVTKEAGADHVLVHSGDGFEERIRELTGGWGGRRRRRRRRHRDVPLLPAGPAPAQSARLLRPSHGRPDTAADRSAQQHPVDVFGGAPPLRHPRGPAPAHRRSVRPGPGRAARPARHRPLCTCTHAVLDGGTATDDAGRLRHAARGHTDRPGGWNPTRRVSSRRVWVQGVPGGRCDGVVPGANPVRLRGDRTRRPCLPLRAVAPCGRGFAADGMRLLFE